MALTAAAVFVFSWFLRFNDPGGSFAGLTDDHFFYLVRGWQILFGDLPVRDFVDHGAPLYYYVGAAVQEVFGRGTLSEIAFSTTVLAAGASLTFWLAARASGSILFGLVGALLQILLEPRFYNYPKILVYAAAIPLLWWFADRPGRWPRAWLALVTAIGFLFRHDHGVFVAIAMATMLLLLRELSWRERLRHAIVYAAVVAALLAPYLVFIEVNGGVGSYVRHASAWAAKDRNRAPVVWPGLFDNPTDASQSADNDGQPARAVAVVRNNLVAWMYYLELALPCVALVLLAASRDGFRPGWPHAVPKLVTVAVLGLVLDAGFLRSPLGARLADPSVALAILVAWLGRALFALATSRTALRPGLKRIGVPVRVALVFVTLPIVFVLACSMTSGFRERLDGSAMVERPGKPIERALNIADQLRREWRLVTWMNRPDRPDLMNLALYLGACTKPSDRIFVQPYIPQVLALSRRAFAGGHADLRPGFFTTDEAQRLTLERLQRQHVPVLLMESNDEYRNFRKSFPLITDYFDRNYHLAGTRLFDGRFAIQLFARNDAPVNGQYEALGWPCFQ